MPSPQVTAPLTGKVPFAGADPAGSGDSTASPPDEDEEASATPMVMLKAPKIMVVDVSRNRQNGVLNFISSLFHLPSGLADGLALKEFALRIPAIRPRGLGLSGFPDPVGPDSACLQITIYRHLRQSVGDPFFGRPTGRSRQALDRNFQQRHQLRTQVPRRPWRYRP